jgi:hypothetical protein
LKHAAKAERVDKVGVRASELIYRLVSPGVVVVVDSIALNRLQVGLELQQALLIGWNTSHAPLQICNLTYELAFEALAGP